MHVHNLNMEMRHIYYDLLIASEKFSRNECLSNVFQNKSIIPKAQHEVHNGVNIAVLSMESSAFIVVSENVTQDDHYMNIYEFSLDHGLKVNHSINCSNAINVEIWYV